MQKMATTQDQMRVTVYASMQLVAAAAASEDSPSVAVALAAAAAFDSWSGHPEIQFSISCKKKREQLKNVVFDVELTETNNFKLYYSAGIISCHTYV
jgi:hypothetical protein